MLSVTAVRRGWDIGKVTAVTQTSSGGRIWSTAFEIALPLYLTVLLWDGLYSSDQVVAGVTHDQAVTYAVIAALLTYLRVGNRSWVRDSVVQHIRLGTIVYWFLWPMKPANYHAVRAAGDFAYALAWAIPAYLVCLSVGAISGPDDWAAGIASSVSFLLGQVIFYLIGLLLDLVCFWTVVSEQIVQMVGFVQALLSGGFAPLWFFPEWFQMLSRLLPFQGIVSVPMSIYTGKAEGVDLWIGLGGQLLWCLLLGALARAVWARALRRVDVLGG